MPTARRLLQGALVSSAVTIVPALGNVEALKVPPLWVLYCLGVLASVMQPAYNPLDKRAPPEDRGTAAQVIWSIYVVATAAVLEAVYWRYPGSLQFDATAGLALALMLAGLILRSWAVATLGEYFTWYITCSLGQPLVQRGPYRFLRHPGYAGALLTYCCGPLFLHSWVASVLAIALLPAIFLRRIRVEEALLLATCGAEYADYRLRVRALVPWVW